MLNVLEVVKKTSDFFAAKGIEAPRLNAELLVGHALGLPRMQLYLQFERTLTDAELDQIRGWVRRRGLREPWQYIVGTVEFGGLRLKVDRRALIPRPETEWMIDTVLARCAAPAVPPVRVLDLGTGSGAIALALASAWPEAAVTAIDRSPEALALAGENAAATGLAARVALRQSDWFAQLPAGERYDLIISNPPYLTEKETTQTAVEVREHEPAAALTAAEGGMADLRAILQTAPDFLAPGGWLALETGEGQHAKLREIAAAHGWTRVESLRDLAGRERCLLAWRDGA